MLRDETYEERIKNIMPCLHCGKRDNTCALGNQFIVNSFCNDECENAFNTNIALEEKKIRKHAKAPVKKTTHGTARKPVASLA